MIGDCVTFITRDLTGKQANGGAVAIHLAADHGLQPVGISSGGLSSIANFAMLIITLVAIHVAPDHGLQHFGNFPKLYLSFGCDPCCCFNFVPTALGSFIRFQALFAISRGF